MLWFKHIMFRIRKCELFCLAAPRRVTKQVNFNKYLQKKVNFFGGDFSIDARGTVNAIVKSSLDKRLASQ